MTDPTFDWDAEVKEARDYYEMESQQATCKGQPLPEPYIEGCMDGFDRCIDVVKRLALKKVFG